MFCEVVHGDRHYPSVILDMSATGIFVRTIATPPVGAEVIVNVRMPGGRHWCPRAEVAREPQRNGASVPVPKRGLGLHLLEIPDDYAEFVASL